MSFFFKRNVGDATEMYME